MSENRRTSKRSRTSNAASGKRAKTGDGSENDEFDDLLNHDENTQPSNAASDAGKGKDAQIDEANQ